MTNTKYISLDTYRQKYTLNKYYKYCRTIKLSCNEYIVLDFRLMFFISVIFFKNKYIVLDFALMLFLFILFQFYVLLKKLFHAGDH